MSVRVNLLPEVSRKRARASRQVLLFVLLGVLLLVAIAGVHVWQLGRLSDVQDERDLIASEVEELRAQEQDLAAFAEIQQRHEQVEAALVAAMSGEISFAGLLQDIAAVRPPETAFTQVDVATLDPQAADGADLRPAVARVFLEGESLRGHAPGVELLLLGLEQIAAFFNVHVDAAQADPEQPEVSIFSIEFDVGEEALTRRYTDGLPEDLP